MDYNKDLAGRVEKAFVSREVREGVTFGQTEKGCVLINGGNDLIGQLCLVRYGLFDTSEQIGKAPITSLVNSNVPKGFEGVGPEEYILYAQWGGEVVSSGDIPLPRDLTRHFGINGVPHYCFVEREFSSSYGRYEVSIDGNVLEYPKISLIKIIRTELPKPRDAIRVVIGSGQRAVEKIKETIESAGYVAIELEDRISL